MLLSFWCLNGQSTKVRNCSPQSQDCFIWHQTNRCPRLSSLLLVFCLHIILLCVFFCVRRWTQKILTMMFFVFYLFIRGHPRGISNQSEHNSFGFTACIGTSVSRQYDCSGTSKGHTWTNLPLIRTLRSSLSRRALRSTFFLEQNERHHWHFTISRSFVYLFRCWIFLFLISYVVLLTDIDELTESMMAILSCGAPLSCRLLRQE